nr:DUF2188 domain-containing protein [Rufibacter sp. LB8]
MKKNQHIVRHPEGWAVKGAGNERATRVTSTQAEAISIGRGIAVNQGSELIIHGKNGQIREKNTYGSDSHPPRG